MGKSVAILTDSNSGITQNCAKALGISVLPMPFYINDELFYEDITLTQEEFYRHLEDDAEIHTSMPVVGEVLDRWDSLLKDYDEVVYIPMSSGLSSSCATAKTLAEDYDGRVQVVDNQRISVTQRQSVLDAVRLAELGYDAAGIKEYLEKTKFDSSIYIYVPTLKYLKKGGRITPAAAAIGTVLNLKPVLQIQGEKLDSFKKARGKEAAKKIMIEAVKNDLENPMVRADGQLLWRVIENLLSNVSKYAQTGSRVYVNLSDPGKGHALLEVKNISQDPLNIPADELMERFKRGDESRNTEGSGLGLAIAKDLTHLMGGVFEITIDGDLFKASVMLEKA